MKQHLSHMSSSPYGAYPQTRLRRNRRYPWIRSLLAETTLCSSDLILPIFVREEESEQRIPSMPGVLRYTVADLVDHVKEVADAGICAVALFPYTTPDKRTETGEEAINPNNLMCQAVRSIRQANIPIGIIVDVALDPYTSHGHDGIMLNQDIHNDQTIAYLTQQAVILAEAGADIVAPSDMMDGRISQIRAALDATHYQHVSILSYAVKYASSLYAPFRDAVGVHTLDGLKDKKTYQMDYRNSREALLEGMLDAQEGADILIVKPGSLYLDILHQYAQQFLRPIFVYQVSGEYAMIQAAARNGWIDGTAVMMESLMAFKRAGAKGILTYAALEVARGL